MIKYNLTDSSLDAMFENLANAIIVQACEDYQYGLLYKNRDNMIVGDKKQIERFFKSDYLKSISKADGEYILERLKQEIEE